MTSQKSGQWEDRGQAQSYFETRAVHCSLCGKAIPRRTWVVAMAGEELLFCEPDCERVYRDYWLPKYGTSAEERRERER